MALYNGNEYLEAEFAAFKLRAAPCNVNYRYVESELAYLIDNSDAKAVFFDDTLTERFDASVLTSPRFVGGSMSVTASARIGPTGTRTSSRRRCRRHA